MPNFQQIGSSNLDLLVTQVNTILNTASVPPNTVYSKIATTIEGGALREDYPVYVSTIAAEKKELTEEVNRNTPAVINFENIIERYATPKEVVSANTKLVDPFQVLMGGVQETVQRISKLPDQLLAKMINTNGLAYDKQPFFSSTHLIQNFRKNTKTFTNDIVADTTFQGFDAARLTLQQMLGEDGNLYDPDMGDLIAIAPNPQIHTKLLTIVNPGLVALPIAGAAASQTTQLVGAAEVMMFPELNQYTSLNPNANKTWYLMRKPRGKQTSLLFRYQMRPQVIVEAMNSPLYYNNFAMGYHIETFCAPSFVLPQCMVRCTLP